MMPQPPVQPVLKLAGDLTDTNLVSPDTFKTVVGVLLGVIVLLALSPWSWFAGSDGVRQAPAQYPPDSVPAGYYPPAPSTAVGMTPEWRSFAATVDRICAVSFNYAIALAARSKETARTQGWGDSQAESAVVRLWGQEDARILRATARLGAPPERPLLFARWRANVRRRTSLFFNASHVAGAGQFETEGGILRLIDRLKARSDRIGQRFGLRVCTSN
jgi:hypothetical protein